MSHYRIARDLVVARRARRSARGATWQIEVEGKPIAASQLRTVAFDEEGYAYSARGTPSVQIWRSMRPVD